MHAQFVVTLSPAIEYRSHTLLNISCVQPQDLEYENMYQPHPAAMFPTPVPCAVFDWQAPSSDPVNRSSVGRHCFQRSGVPVLGPPNFLEGQICHNKELGLRNQI